METSAASDLYCRADAAYPSGSVYMQLHSTLAVRLLFVFQIQPEINYIVPFYFIIIYIIGSAVLFGVI